MNKGMTLIVVVFRTAMLLSLISMETALADIYKVVDAEGNITYTDQAPADGSPPMDLPPLSIVDTDYVPEAPAEGTGESEAEGDEEGPPTPREMRQMFKDFHITSPMPEETFWGTENAVVVSWGSKSALLPDMRVLVFVDGQPQPETSGGVSALTLDRGEHSVYAVLLDQRGRRVATAPTVTFYVKQNSENFNRPAARPGGAG